VEPLPGLHLDASSRQRVLEELQLLDEILNIGIPDLAVFDYSLQSLNQLDLGLGCEDVALRSDVCQVFQHGISNSRRVDQNFGRVVMWGEPYQGNVQSRLISLYFLFRGF